ncbi:hypothetical protein FACS1894218_5560 [Bacilli bacterium]|nr:hypothetical protein FACS1894218_5560 [Bacilli bacterium]
MFTNNFNVSIPCTYPRMVEDTGGVEHLTLTIPTAGYTDIGKLTITSATYTQDNIISIEGLNGDTDIHDYAVSALTDGDQRDPTREITIHLFANSLR